MVALRRAGFCSTFRSVCFDRLREKVSTTNLKLLLILLLRYVPAKKTIPGESVPYKFDVIVNIIGSLQSTHICYWPLTCRKWVCFLIGGRWGAGGVSWDGGLGADRLSTAAGTVLGLHYYREGTKNTTKKNPDIQRRSGKNIASNIFGNISLGCDFNGC